MAEEMKNQRAIDLIVAVGSWLARVVEVQPLRTSLEEKKG